MKTVREKDTQIAAFFDLDGTLMPLPSLERRFFQALRYRHAIPSKNYFFWLTEAVRLLPRGPAAVKYGNKMYLRSISSSVTINCIARMHTRNGDWSFHPGILKLLKQHAQQNHSIVLITGTLEPLAHHVTEKLETEFLKQDLEIKIRVCATRLEERDGRLTGKIIGNVMLGEEKERAARKLAAEMGWKLPKCYAYGDSAADRWLLQVVGHPTAVNADKTLARIARKNGWSSLNSNRQSSNSPNFSTTNPDVRLRKRVDSNSLVVDDLVRRDSVNGMMSRLNAENFG